MTYSIVACEAIGADRAENTIRVLLFTGHYLATTVVYLIISWSLASSGSTCYSRCCYVQICYELLSARVDATAPCQHAFHICLFLLFSAPIYFMWNGHGPTVNIHISRDRYPASLIGASVGSTENTAFCIVACWTVFTELLPGNAMIKFVTV
jgi:hypothetical protein